MRPVQLAALSCALIAGSISAKADAIPYPNPGVIAPTTIYTAQNTGNIMGYFIRGGPLSNGGEIYTDSIQLVDTTSGTSSGWLFDSQTTYAGTQADFGNVTAGDNLVFEIRVQQPNGSTFMYASDPALSQDGHNHAYLTPFSGGILNGVLLPAGLYAGMEDTYISPSTYLPDLDYRDITTLFENIHSSPAPAVTPEPSSILLFGTGLVGAAAALRRKLSR